MKRQNGILRTPLNRIFYAPSHIAVLRALIDSLEGMSGREVARQAGINHQSCTQAISRLEEIGILQRLGTGKIQLIRLNRENFLVKELLLPLLKKERMFFSKIKAEIKSQFSNNAISVIIFGSAARKEEQPESDFDICIVVKNIKEKRKTQSIIDNILLRSFITFGIKVSSFVFTLHEAKSRIKKKDPLFKSILSEGIFLTGKQLRDL
jgi:predicted nucleotidyltransferase